MDIYDVLRQEGLTVSKEKGEHVFRQGESDKHLYFVQSGMLKAYYTSHSAKEFIKSFIMPQDLIGSLTSVYSKQSCSFSLVCLDSTVLLKIEFAVLRDYSQRYHNIANELIELLIGFAMKKERREYEFLCLSAEERYKLLEKNSPELIAAVTQNDIAGYLGVTAVALSRIKHRMPKL